MSANLSTKWGSTKMSAKTQCRPKHDVDQIGVGQNSGGTYASWTFANFESYRDKNVTTDWTGESAS